MSKELTEMLQALLTLRGYSSNARLINSEPPRYALDVILQTTVMHTITCNTLVVELEMFK